MSENLTETNLNYDVTPGKLLPGKTLLQIHMNTERILPKAGLKEFRPSHSWLEKRQIESLLDEHRNILKEERVEKWGSLAGAFWNPSVKLAEVTRRIGKHFRTMGFEKNGKLYLNPEEALHLLETNSLELLFGGVPMSLQQAYAVLLGSETGCTANQFRVYSHLVRQGYRVLRSTTQTQSTQYERQIRLDQHAHQKRCYPEDVKVINADITSSMNHHSHSSSSTNNSNSEEIKVGMRNNNFSVQNLADVKAHIGQEGASLKVKSENISQESDKGDTANIVDEIMDSESQEDCHQNMERSSLDSSRSPDDTGNAESKAYGIAKSLVSLGTDLMKGGTVASEGNNQSNSDMNAVLCEQIIQVLGSHVGEDISQETLKAVALNAARTILSHGVSESSNQGKDLSAEASAQLDKQKSIELPHQQENEESKGSVDLNPARTILSHGVSESSDLSAEASVESDKQKSIEVSYQQEGEESKDSVDLNAADDEQQSDDSTINDDSLLFTSKERNMETPITDVALSVKDIIKRQNDLSICLKRQQVEEIDENELAIAKKAKLLDVSDSEIEILNVVSEKKVEVIDLSGDESNVYEPCIQRKTSAIVKKREIIDVDIDSEGDPDSSSSSGSSDISTDNSSGSSIVCIESKQPKSFSQKSGYEKLFDNRRKSILNTFPCMHNKHEINLTAPDPELLPRNVLPKYNKYVINRWKLELESRQMHQQMQLNSIVTGRAVHPHNVNSWEVQPNHPQSNFLFGNIPNNPWALMQTLAHLLLPITNQAPQLHQRWSQGMSLWPHQQPSWPRPAWPRQPYFKPRDRWYQRPRGYRHHSPRFPRQHYSPTPFSPRSQYQNFPRHGFQNRNSPNMESVFDSSCKNRPQDSGLNEIPKGHILNSQKVQESNNTLFRRGASIQSVHMERKERKKKAAEREPCKGSSRYFKPPKKYHHMKTLMEEKRKEATSRTSSDVLENVETLKQECSSSESSRSESEEEEDQSDDADNHLEGGSTSRIPLLQPDQCSNFASVCRSLQVIQRADSLLLGSWHCSEVLKVLFDVFLPNVSFKKGSPPPPDYHLCIMDVNDTVPSAAMLSILSRKLDHSIPILFAIVHPDSISFLQLLDIYVPFLPVDL